MIVHASQLRLSSCTTHITIVALLGRYTLASITVTVAASGKGVGVEVRAVVFLHETGWLCLWNVERLMCLPGGRSGNWCAWLVADGGMV